MKYVYLLSHFLVSKAQKQEKKPVEVLTNTFFRLNLVDAHFISKRNMVLLYFSNNIDQYS